MLFVLGLSRWQPVTVALAFLLGLSGVMFTTTAQTRLQLVVPDQMRGRVMSMHLLLFAGTTPIGSALVGTLAEKTGVANMILEIAGLCALGVGFGLWFARKTHRASPADPGDAPL